MKTASSRRSGPVHVKEKKRHHETRDKRVVSMFGKENESAKKGDKVGTSGKEDASQKPRLIPGGGRTHNALGRGEGVKTRKKRGSLKRLLHEPENPAIEAREMSLQIEGMQNAFGGRTRDRGSFLARDGLEVKVSPIKRMRSEEKPL